MTSPLEALLDEGREAGVFSQAQASVWHRGRPLFVEGAAGTDRDTLFDLASVTKVATTCVFLALRARGLLKADTPVGALLPEVVSPSITLEDLLFHRSGLPAWRPFFALPAAMPAVFAAGGGEAAFEASRRAVIAAAGALPPETPVFTRAVYSDVGFILLGEALAAAAGLPLDRAFQELVAAPLGVALHYRRLGVRGLRGLGAVGPRVGDPGSSAATVSASSEPGIAITGTLRPRPPAPGQEGTFSLAAVDDVPGDVDDDNAWAMDGVAGHAGLFGTGESLGRFGQLLLEELEGAGRLAPATLWSQARLRDPHTPGSERTLGFDTVSASGSSAGRFMSTRAIGHLGFTGTSLWIDPERALVVALVTNRTWRGRDPAAIRAFRPRFHDCVAAILPSTSAAT